VLVEKILRVQPDVKHLYLLIKAKDERGAKRRLREEILGSALFAFLRCRHGDAYAAFMERKLSAVVGDIGRDGLGIDPPALARLAAELDVVVNSAATTTFDERSGPDSRP
jgi:fatty acyl-CoA reductase